MGFMVYHITLETEGAKHSSTRNSESEKRHRVSGVAGLVVLKGLGEGDTAGPPLVLSALGQPVFVSPMAYQVSWRTFDILLWWREHRILWDIPKGGFLRNNTACMHAALPAPIPHYRFSPA